jgi:hypothetical protein
MCTRAETHDIALLSSRKQEVTECNQKLYPLLRLPLELRAQMYDYIHTPPGIITVSDDLRCNGFHLIGRMRLSGQHTPECERRKSTCSFSVPNNVLALPITCRQIYTETIHYLYDSNTFCFNDSGLVLSLPSTIPVKHLRTITSLCFTFDLAPLTTTLHLPRLLQCGTDWSLAAIRRRKEYIEFWHFLATTLSNLQILLVSFHRKNTWVATDPRIYKWVLAPLFQFKEGASRSSWSPKLTLFDVRLNTWFPTYFTFVNTYQTMGAPFFLGTWCDCGLDCWQCIECKNSDDYCLRSATGAWVVV